MPSFKLLSIILISAIGGCLFVSLGLPLPWLLGALVASALSRLTIIPSAEISRNLRDPFIVVIAWTIGASISTEGLLGLITKPAILLAVFIAAVLSSLVSFLIYWRIGRFRKREALLACLPAGVTETMLFAERHGFNAPPIIVAHTVRVFLSVMLVPLILAGERASQSTSFAFDMIPSAMHLGLLALGLSAFLLGRRINMPAPAFLAPILAIGAVSISPLPGEGPPIGWLNIAQVIIGASLGVEVAKAAQQSFRYYVLSLVAAGAMFGVICIAALIADRMLTTSFPFALLAIAPGGVSEMALVAFSIGEPAAMIVSLHLARVFATVGFLIAFDGVERGRTNGRSEFE